MIRVLVTRRSTGEVLLDGHPPAVVIEHDIRVDVYEHEEPSAISKVT